MAASSRPSPSASADRINVWTLTRKAGRDLLVERAWEQLWLDKLFLGLRCDLTKLPPVLKARLPVRMEPVDLATYGAFRDEFERVSGHDAIEVYAREQLRAAGVGGAHHTVAADGQPAYVQWLVTAPIQATLHRYQPGRYRRLSPDEVLLEAAYTFSAYRGQGLMSEGMWQLLECARSAGARIAWTYVALENTASLRGCARVGFEPAHLRRTWRRLSGTHSEFLPLSLEAVALWDQSAPAPPV